MSDNKQPEELDDDCFDEPDFEDIEENEINYHDCPRCGRSYDEIDYEYQICHYCGFNANTLIL